MNTIFKITLTGSNSSCWDVDLGKNILEGVDTGTRNTWAEAHRVVLLQNNQKLLLRECDDGDCLVAALKSIYPGVKVTPHVKAAPKVKLTEKQLIARLLNIDEGKVTSAMVEYAKAMLPAVANDTNVDEVDEVDDDKVDEVDE
jgi:hypothetical protein